ncbi:uncharacterized protein LOC142221913 [Haematobia irritans]|uniref:uncharacterized protein LOC142221913 n=1 Tax=Haematobia irritans TaxID=7368 RepID=UPI003F4F6E15
MWKISKWFLFIIIIADHTKFGLCFNSHSRGIFPSSNAVLFENNMYANFMKHPCRRQCRSGAGMTCYYKFFIHDYQMMGPECQKCLNDPDACAAERCIYGDGERLPMQLVNYQYPGPPIEVCQNDVLIVDTYNNLTEDASIHWHGLLMKKTPESDGVPTVTQYPIKPGDLYRACFEVTEAGTRFYHSHSSWQRAKGVWGIFIIRQTRRMDPHSRLYDYDNVDHSLQLQDIGESEWTLRNILINGMGRNQASELYRIRIVLNGVANCPMEVSFDEHKMQVISTDGNDIEPVFADKLQITSAERFDVIISTEKPPRAHWIRVRGMFECENITQYAILQYKGVPITQMPKDPDEIPAASSSSSSSARLSLRKSQIVINALAQFSPDVTITTSNDSVNSIRTVDLKALAPMPCTADEVYRTYYTSFGYILENGVYYLQVGNITYAPTNISMLQGRHLYNEDEVYCNRTSLLASGRDCRTSNCQCPHVIRIPAYQCIEIVVVNFMEETHPFHLHGYTFRVVGQGVFDNPADLYNKRSLSVSKLHSTKCRYQSLGALPLKRQCRGPPNACNRSYNRGIKPIKKERFTRNLYPMVQSEIYCKVSLNTSEILAGYIPDRLNHEIFADWNAKDVFTAFRKCTLTVFNSPLTKKLMRAVGSHRTLHEEARDVTEGSVSHLKLQVGFWLLDILSTGYSEVEPNGSDSPGEEGVEEADRQGRLKRHSPNYRAVAKDTVQIPILGYIIIRFKSDNPGFWLMHCHIERHFMDGMAAVLKIGEDNQIRRVTSLNRCNTPAVSCN